MDEKKIAFITCVNDEEEYAECRYYLERLYTPKGYTKDIISILEAPSMAAGYNAGMGSTDAKYKVYLHQDVFIKNFTFIEELIKIFASDQQIGIMGMIGKRNPRMDAPGLVMNWDTGKVVDGQWIWYFDHPAKGDGYSEVQVADGLLLATQYDIPWREDIFDGWNFYDISQCMEFRKAGFKVIVPWQDEEWCFHDSLYSIYTYYYDYYVRFIEEYGKLVGVDAASLNFPACETEKAAVRFLSDIEECFARGGREYLRQILLAPKQKRSVFLKEYVALVEIDWQEEQEQAEPRFWQEGMSLAQLLLKQRKLKRALKRIEYTEDISQKDWIRENYSKYAIINICGRYIINKEKVLQEIIDLLL